MTQLISHNNILLKPYLIFAYLQEVQKAICKTRLDKNINLPFLNPAERESGLLCNPISILSLHSRLSYVGGVLSERC